MPAEIRLTRSLQLSDVFIAPQPFLDPDCSVWFHSGTFTEPPFRQKLNNGTQKRNVECARETLDVPVIGAVECLSHDLDQRYTAQHCHRAKSPMGGETCTICLSNDTTHTQSGYILYAVRLCFFVILGRTISLKY